MAPNKGSRIVAIAAKEVGYTEVPANSNKTKYGKWFGFDGVPWCGVFVSWCCAQAGYPLEKMGFPKGFAGCQTAVAHYRKTKQIVTDPLPGDLVFYDWNGDGRYDHTGIYYRTLTPLAFEAFEGNTSMTNQSNGGEVMQRKRTKTKGVLFVRPHTI